ncbi:aminotransferase class I/II-fold pyridoxal phosphate-dependent enzyme [Oenococcus kitaharae]|uniref:Aminotransferase n=1 Tax=Oenococcus kitaharae DSM 17330 TaxID=1045004 RepID=G9WGD4_9LACO|nr:aminotransferase class I/II-fold pyridoxal phosphate-dependent enzyme [Oenococcus kitaharae]EHN59742.1 N-acetyl-LL-diaminopimelate aminotransferase [Oenococcus kitaharae DSM 17330]OEY83570.1 aromatic amino acid aminotransferase [Oenococcus kitaharae]OEY85368.1 aromatic amino acid aminotransferase [Oenococcus kitaharae]OEY86221.1 aromatic amino acid aminotransferase [Oenococcus kitaharae]
MPELKKGLIENVRPDIRNIKVNQIRAIDTEFRQIDGLLRLTLGEPDFNAPELVKKAMVDSIEKNHSHYSTARGSEEFRQAAANFLKRNYQLDFDPDTEILTTVGSTEAIFATLSTILKEGDELLVPSPAYPLYEQLAHVNHTKMVYIPTNDTDFVLTPQRLQETIAQHPNARAIVLTYPNNPTGVDYSREQLQQLADVIAKTNLLVVSDEIYSTLNYVSPHISIGTILPEQTVVLNGVSKSHAMTGDRIGFVAAPKELISEIVKIHQFAITAVSNPAMAGATAALNEGDAVTEQMRAEYQQRRDYLIPEFKKLGFDVAAPDGAFYLFLKIPADQNQDDVAFARELAHKALVGLIPGSCFGPGGEGYLRLSYAASENNLKEALARLQKYLAKSPC